jgi:hypothetical protein
MGGTSFAVFTKKLYLDKVDEVTRTEGPWRIVTVGIDVAYFLSREGKTWFISDRGFDAPLVETKENE